MGIGFGELIWMGSVSILLVVVYKGVLSIESKLDELLKRKDGVDG